MLKEQVDAILRAYNQAEIKHKKNISSKYEMIPLTKDYKKNEVYNFIIPSSSSVQLYKNARFDAVPMHVHSNIEINYMYSGSCIQTIDYKTHTIKKGQMTFIDTKTPHAIGYTGEDDILINFVVSKEVLNSSFFSKLSDNNLITTFFINAINSDSDHLNYLIFNTENNRRLEVFVQEFIWEYYHPSRNTEEIKNSLFILIILEMINSLDTSINLESISQSNTTVIAALKYMETHFKTCTLESTANHVHINPVYLTTLLKKYFHKSYKELIIELRLKYAEKLLLNSTQPIDAIARECGYQNLTYFYQKFKEHYHCSPKEYRLKNQSSHHD